MPFDGAFAHILTNELNDAKDCHIDKIYQPSRDELVFLLRKKGFVKRLLISAKIGSAKVCFTEDKYENPAVPPMFCMLVRKHFSSARLIEIRQQGLERIIELCFLSTNEMGDRVNTKIICEMLGQRTNIILVGEDGRIIDAVRRSSIEDGSRLVQPGAIYTYPETQNKLSILDTDIDVLTDKILAQSELPLSKALLNVLDGFSPLISREIAFLVSGGDEITLNCDRKLLVSTLNSVKTALNEGGTPTLLFKNNNEPFDFTFLPIKQYGSTITSKEYDSYCELLNAFYSSKDNSARTHQASAEIVKLVNNLYQRAQKRLSLRLEELKECENRETFRIYGELLKANLHAIPNGAEFAEVQNYYDENLALIKIPLNPAISPSQNAAKYFKDYKKTYTAEQTLAKLTEKDREEIEYFESVLDSLNRAESPADLNDIRTELTEGGYLKRPKGVNPNKKTAVTGFLEFKSVEGYRIFVGKNNRQNDYLTTRLANKNDLWFHTKNIAGSHVLVLSDGGEVSDETILFAASLAAKHSKAAASSQVAVDYTPVKYVKKPNGAKAGMVIYTTNKTVFVTPKE